MLFRSRLLGQLTVAKLTFTPVTPITPDRAMTPSLPFLPDRITVEAASVQRGLWVCSSQTRGAWPEGSLWGGISPRVNTLGESIFHSSFINGDYNIYPHFSRIF